MKRDTTLPKRDDPTQWFNVADWIHVGFAESMQDAKRQFGGAPVLVEV
jgi:hypothetical protein